MGTQHRKSLPRSPFAYRLLFLFCLMGATLHVLPSALQADPLTRQQVASLLDRFFARTTNAQGYYYSSVRTDGIGVEAALSLFTDSGYAQSDEGKELRTLLQESYQGNPGAFHALGLQVDNNGSVVSQSTDASVLSQRLTLDQLSSLLMNHASCRTAMKSQPGAGAASLSSASAGQASLSWSPPRHGLLRLIP